MDPTDFYLFLAPAAFLEYEEERISEFGCGVTEVPYNEMKRLLLLCGEPTLLYPLEEHDEFDNGIELHSVIWEGLVRIARKRLETEAKIITLEAENCILRSSNFSI